MFNVFLKKVLSSCLLSLSLVLCYAQTDSLAEQALMKSAEISSKAAVRVMGWDAETQRQNSSQFSAVCVSKDGYLLTVAHAIRPGKLYKVSFADGRTGLARGRGVIELNEKSTWPDVAVMKLEGKDTDWPFVEMGSSASLSAGVPCFGVSYPESLRLLQPTLRLGKIVNPLDQWNYVHSTCIMETGDSGGPLFDWHGRVIGIHSRIDKAESLSFEIPVDTYRKYWSALTVDSLYTTWPDSSKTNFNKKKTTAVSTNPVYTSGEFVPAEGACARISNAVVSLISKTNGNINNIFGTVVNISADHAVILSKSSEVGDEPVILVDNKHYPTRVLYRDRDTDLVFLDGKGISVNGLLYQEEIARRQDSDSGVGKLLFSAFPDTRRQISVCGLVLDSLPMRFSSGGIGLRLQEQDGLPTVTSVEPLGAGERADLQNGDRILHINDVDVSSAAKINGELVKYLPGDSIVVDFLRNGNSKSTSLVLTKRILREENHSMNHFRGGKSARRDGFRDIFIHDARVHADECGGPIFDNEGLFQGINIARFSHTATIALSLKAVRESLKRYTETSVTYNR